MSKNEEYPQIVTVKIDDKEALERVEQMSKNPHQRQVKVIDIPEPNIFKYEKDGKMVQTQLLKIMVFEKADLVIFVCEDGHGEVISYSTFEEMRNTKWEPGDPEFKEIKLEDN